MYRWKMERKREELCRQHGAIVVIEVKVPNGVVAQMGQGLYVMLMDYVGETTKKID